jgi:hypothetical protein
MAASTRPLTLGEILDRTVQLYRRNFLLFTGVSVLPSAAYVLVTGSVSLYIAEHGQALKNPKAGPEVFLMLGLAGLAFFVIGLPILLGLSAITVSALNGTAIAINRGEQTTVRASFAYAFRFFWRSLGILCLQILFSLILPGAAGTGIVVIGSILVALIAGTGGGTGLAVVMGLLMFLLVAALFVICVLIWLRLSLAFPVCASEGQTAWNSIKRSNLLSKGTRGRVFVMYLLVTVLTVIVYYMLTLPVDLIVKLVLFKSTDAIEFLTHPPMALQVFNLFVSCLERAFVLPIYGISLVLFYVDQRTRLEGYDIEQLMANAGWSEFPPAFAPPQVVASSYPVQAYAADRVPPYGTGPSTGSSFIAPHPYAAVAPHGPEIPLLSEELGPAHVSEEPQPTQPTPHGEGDAE